MSTKTFSYTSGSKGNSIGGTDLFKSVVTGTDLALIKTMLESSTLAIVNRVGSHAFSSTVVEESDTIISTDWVNCVVTSTSYSERNKRVITVLGVLYESQKVNHECAAVCGASFITPSFVSQSLTGLSKSAHVLVSDSVGSAYGKIDVWTVASRSDDGHVMGDY